MHLQWKFWVCSVVTPTFFRRSQLIPLVDAVVSHVYQVHVHVYQDSMFISLSQTGYAWTIVNGGILIMEVAVIVSIS